MIVAKSSTPKAPLSAYLHTAVAEDEVTRQGRSEAEELRDERSLTSAGAEATRANHAAAPFLCSKATGER